MCRCVSGTWDRVNGLRVRLVFFTPRSMSYTEDGSGDAASLRRASFRAEGDFLVWGLSLTSPHWTIGAPRQCLDWRGL